MFSTVNHFQTCKPGRFNLTVVLLSEFLNRSSLELRWLTFHFKALPPQNHFEVKCRKGFSSYNSAFEIKSGNTAVAWKKQLILKDKAYIYIYKPKEKINLSNKHVSCVLNSWNIGVSYFRAAVNAIYKRINQIWVCAKNKHKSEVTTFVFINIIISNCNLIAHFFL